MTRLLASPKMSQTRGVLVWGVWAPNPEHTTLPPHPTPLPVPPLTPPPHPPPLTPPSPPPTNPPNLCLCPPTPRCPRRGPPLPLPKPPFSSRKGQQQQAPTAPANKRYFSACKISQSDTMRAPTRTNTTCWRKETWAFHDPSLLQPGPRHWPIHWRRKGSLATEAPDGEQMSVDHSRRIPETYGVFK